MNSSHALAHNRISAGYCWPQAPVNVSNCALAAWGVGAVYTSFRSLAIASQYLRDVNRKLLRSRCSLNYRGGCLMVRLTRSVTCGMPRWTVVALVVSSSSWASFCLVAVRETCRPSTSPSQP